MKGKIMKSLLVLAIVILFIFPVVSSTSMRSFSSRNNYNIYHQSDVQKTSWYIQHSYDESSMSDGRSPVVINEKSAISTGEPANSSWPMYCHDVRHTGRSPYSTVDTWDEIWNYKITHVANGDVVVDNNETIYFGADGLYAVNLNGILKWKYITNFLVDGAPAIDGDGIIYFGTVYGSPSYLFALYPNGTLKWKYSATSIFSSPAIGDDGTIYFGDSDNWYIKALYPNGTLKWAYKTDLVVYSSPAIGPDGTIYCGCHDTYLYALYPNNGTLKWKYKTGDWIRTSPCIGDDGTIYVDSLDSYLYAINPNGSLRWKTDVGAGTSPTIGQGGTIYCGYNKLYAINPINGSVKWTFDVGGTMRGGTPCNSVDGTIYVGTSDGGKLIAINPDGTLKWRKGIGECESAPAIGEDGTVYVGSSYSPDEGYFYAFGIGPLEADANGPYYGLINQLVQFKGSSGGGYSPHSYHWDFGDIHTSDEQNPVYIYTSADNYTVTLTVTDNTSNTSSDTSWAWIQATNTPPNKPTINGPTKGEYGISYDYKFVSADPDGTPIWYYVDWGDNSNTGWFGPYNSGQEVTQSHFWYDKGTYTISCKAKDPYNAEGEWGTLTVTMPLDLQQISQSVSQQINHQSSNQLILKMLQQFPITFPILRQLMGLNS